MLRLTFRTHSPSHAPRKPHLPLPVNVSAAGSVPWDNSDRQAKASMGPRCRSSKRAGPGKSWRVQGQRLMARLKVVAALEQP